MKKLQKRKGNAMQLWKWKTWVRQWTPQIPTDKQGKKKFSLPILRAVALAIADHGNYGVQCFAADATIATEIPCSREQVLRCRKFLIAEEIFELSGETAGWRSRTNVLDICLPNGELWRAQPQVAKADVLGKCACGGDVVEETDGIARCVKCGMPFGPAYELP